MFLQCLRVLCMSSCKLEACPLELPMLTSLHHLSLQGNLIYDIPMSLKSLAQLQTLNCRRNRLATMPEVILQLTALSSLDVSENEDFQFTDVTVAVAKKECLTSFSFPTPCRACVWTPSQVRMHHPLL